MLDNKNFSLDFKKYGSGSMKINAYTDKEILFFISGYNIASFTLDIFDAILLRNKLNEWIGDSV